MNTIQRRKQSFYIFVVLTTILSLIWPLPIASPARASSNGSLAQPVSTAIGAHASTQYVMPCPGDIGVNTWNGNLVVPRTDLYLPARGIPLELLMTYNSQRRGDGLTTYGPGWRLGYHIAYEIDPYNGNFVVQWGDGNTSVFPVIGNHLYAPRQTPEMVAARYAPGKYFVRMFDGKTYYFDNVTHRRITRIEDLNGNALVFTYDGSGQLTRVANTAGGYFDFTYTAGKLTRVTDSAGRSVQYQYDASGDQTRLIDTMGVTITYAYSGTEHLLTQIFDPQGNSVAVGYGAPADLPSARRVAWVQANSLRREFGYSIEHGFGITFTTRVTDTVGAESRVNIFQYNPSGTLRRVVDAEGGSQEYGWDLNGNLIMYSNRLGQRTVYTYDERGNLLTMEDALGNITRYTWHPLFNSITSITDPLGRTTRYNYDDRGNLIGIVDPQGNKTGFEYDAYGQLVKMIDARGHPITYTYDIYGNPTSFTNALGQSGQFQYDAAGNLIRLIGPDGAQATFTYNAAGENTRSTDPLGYSRLITYTDTGLVAAITDEAGRTSTYAYDARARLIQVNDALGGVRRFTYNDFGYLTSMTDPNNHTHTFGYDRLGRIITDTDPLGRVSTYGYDSEGNLLTYTDAAGQITTFTYDALNRHIRTTYPDGSQVQLGYDAVGNVITATGPGFSYRYTYDENNHLVNVHDLTLGTAITYTYDAVGNVRSMTDPDGGVTYYFYDAVGHLVRLVNPLGETTTWEYNARGLVSKVTWPNDTWAELRYDALGRITELTHRKADGSALAHYTYTYDPVGNRLTTTEDGYGTTTYTYDALNRLVRAAGPEGTIVYAYDAVGNRTAMTDTTGVTTYTYDAANQLLQAVGPAGTTQYQYDHRGNLITRTVGTAVTVYTYNGANRLVGVKLPDGSQQTFTYDQSGLRRSRTDASGTTYYVYDPLSQNLLLERQGGATVARYTTGPMMDELISQRRGGSSTFYHADALGSIIAVSDPAQNAVARYRYDPFGRPTLQTGSVVNPFRFIGRPWDGSSGLYDLRQRAYDPATGRFLTPDPVRVPMLPDLHTHPYGYAGNNPVVRVDREGLLWNVWAWAETGINMFAAGFDAWRNGGNFTDIAQATLVSGLVDSVNALLGGIIPNALRDPVKNLIGQIIDWARGKRCEINWAEVARSIGIGLVKDIVGALFKLGMIGKDTYSNIIEQLHNGVQGMLADAAVPVLVPVAAPGPCQKRRQQPPLVQEQPRRQLPPRPPVPQQPLRSRPIIVGDQGGRYGGGTTGTATVRQLTPNPLPPGSGQFLTHEFQIHNTSITTTLVNLKMYYFQDLHNMSITASLPLDYVQTYDSSFYGSVLMASATGVPSTTLVYTLTGSIPSSEPLETGDVLEPYIFVTIDDQLYPLDAPTEVGGGGGEPAPDLALYKFDRPDPVTAGDLLTYTLRLENTGGITLTNVLITETYPVSVTYVAATPSPTWGNNRWELDKLEVQEVKTITITVRVNGDLRHCTVLTNTVQASSDQTPVQTVTEIASVRHHPLLNVTKRVSTWPLLPGRLVTFTLSYANRGTGTMENLMAVESFDPRLRFISATPAPMPGSTHIWSLGTLGPGASGNITVIMQVTNTLPYTSPIHNEAVFFARQMEPVIATMLEWNPVYLPLVLRQAH